MTSPPCSDLRLGRHELRGDATEEICSLESIGVGADERNQQHRPDRDRADDAREIGGPAPAQKPDQERDQRRRACEALMIETENRRPGRGDEQRGERAAQNEKRREEAHQPSRFRVLSRPPRTARDRALRKRSPSPAMIAARSGSLMSSQAAISSVERPQPMQSAVSGSTTQILTQGVDISMKGMGVI